jgi:hypothetical protein
MKKAALLSLLLGCISIAFFSSCAGAPQKTETPAERQNAAVPAGTAGAAAAPASEPKASGEAAAPSSAPAPVAIPEVSKSAVHKEDSGVLRGAEAESTAAPEFMESDGKGGTRDETAAGPTLSSRGGAAPGLPREAPAVSGLQAGFADDNKQFNYFVNFLSQYGGEVEHFTMPIQERIILKVSDQAGKPIPNVGISVSGGVKPLVTGKTYADGTFLFFPSEYGSTFQRYTVSLDSPVAKKDLAVERAGLREVGVQFQAARPQYQNVPLDILFIMDTTGSMSDEIERLKATIEIINLNLSSLSSKPKVRFGMVLYRDREDEYVTQVVPLTADLAAFQKQLAKVTADGGGDEPEDLQAALEDAVKNVAWDPSGIRLAFIVTDAPPHLDYPDEKFTYVDAAREASRQGIKFYSVGTGGLDLAGELVLRQISQYTYAKYIFLTYGEKGESMGGEPGSVSHHTGANFQTDKLEAIIIRFAKEELSYLTDQPMEEEGDYFQAVKLQTEQNAETLSKLFDQAISQIIDYASISIPMGTPTGALPVVPQAGAPAVDAEYFGEQLVLSLAKNRTFAAVERKDLQAVLKELELQMSGIMDEANAAKVGQVIGAKMLLSSAMYDRGSNYELFMKLLRVETGEILSVTKLVVDKRLGLSVK